MAGVTSTRHSPIDYEAQIKAHVTQVIDRVDLVIASVTCRVSVQKLPSKIALLQKAREIFQIYLSDNPSNPLEKVADGIDQLRKPFLTKVKERKPLFPRDGNLVEMVKVFDKVAKLALDTMENVMEYDQDTKENGRFPGKFQLSKFDIDFLKSEFCKEPARQFKDSIECPRSTVSFWKRGEFCYVQKESKDEILKANEAAILTLIGDPRVIKGGTVLQRREFAVVNEERELKRNLIFVMEYANQGDLYDFSGKDTFTRQDFLEVLIHIPGALQRLHENGCLDKDLKIENILLTQGKNRSKLGDVELIAPPEVGEFRGSIKCNPLEAYPDPDQSEVVENSVMKSKTIKTGPFSVVWSFGVLLFEGYTGIDFISINYQKDSLKVQKQKALKVVTKTQEELDKYVQKLIATEKSRDPARFKRLGDDSFFKDLLGQCLKRDPKERITTEDLTNKLKEELFKFHKMRAALLADECSKPLADECSMPSDFFDEIV